MEFDPYSQWLDIPPQEQPPDHYRLLGIGRFETSPEIIQAAADARMSLVRKFQMGPRGRYTQELLNELSAAKLTLLDAKTRDAYNETLRETTTISNQTVTQVGAPAELHPPWSDVPSPAAQFGMPSPKDRLSATDDPMVLVDASTDHGRSADSDEADESETPVYARPWFLILITAMLVAVAGLAVGVQTILERRGDGKPLHDTVVDQTDPVPVSPSTTDSAELPETPEEPPVLVFSEADGSVNLVASTAQLRGGLQLDTCEDHNVIAGWSSQDCSAAWRFRIMKADFYSVRLIYAVTEDAEGCTLEIDVNADGQETRPDGLRHTVSMRGGPNTFIEDEDHLMIRHSGENTLVVSTDSPTPQGLMQLQAIRLLPRNKQ